MKKFILAILVVALLVAPALAEKQTYVFYDKTTPFQGYIRETGKVDPNEAPDGSTVKERLDRLLIRYPGSEVKYFPLGLDPDGESQKVIGGALVPLLTTDITPMAQKAQKALDEALKRQSIVDNLPSWAQVETNINSILSMADAKAFLLKLARVVYWDVKNRAD